MAAEPVPSGRQLPSPATLGRRYSPLLVLAAVQLMLVMLSPSTPVTTASNGLGGTGGYNGVAAGTGGTGGTGTAGPGAAGAPGAAGGGASGDFSGGGTSAAAGGGSVGTGGSGGAGSAGAGAAFLGGGGAVPGATGPVDLSRCDANKQEIGPTFYRPPCAPVWHGGDNGGATMSGVDATTIKYVFFAVNWNPEVRAVLQQKNLTASFTQLCQALKAFDAEINLRWEAYGRKFVSIDGPGNHSGLAAEKSDGGTCSFPFFASQCNQTPPDPPCDRAEADLIASMHPAYVMAPLTGSGNPFYDQSGKDHIVVAGGENEPNQYHQNVSPFFYDFFMSGTRAMSLTAEYYCKKLYNKPVQFAGVDVEHPGNPLAPPPKRKVAITFPSTNGDQTSKISADEFVKNVTGGMCGSPGDDVKEYPYQSDITTAQQQSTTTVTELKNSGVTTLVFFGDAIAPVFLSNTAEQENYHPEIIQSGTGLVDYDVLAQLYNPDVWQHNFGVSTLTNTVPFDQDEAMKASNDVKGGELDRTENLNWAYYSLMATSFQVAGPRVTPIGIRDALFSVPPLGGTAVHATVEFGRPDDLTATRDAREVYWCVRQNSPVNNEPGAYISTNAGKRFSNGQLNSAIQVFPNGFC